ncbi:hypothetical protein J6590_046052 [Homalodisca vitripennis]|nr:hypothetical protein J6590_046052 [Homalodisca vitripennis]
MAILINAVLFFPIRHPSTVKQNGLERNGISIASPPFYLPHTLTNPTEIACRIHYWASATQRIKSPIERGFRS